MHKNTVNTEVFIKTQACTQIHTNSHIQNWDKIIPTVGVVPIRFLCFGHLTTRGQGMITPPHTRTHAHKHTSTHAHKHTSTQIEQIKMEWRDSAACCHKQWACDGHYQQAVRAKYHQLFECVNVCSPHPHTNAFTLINSDMPTHTHTQTQRHKNSFPLQWMRQWWISHSSFHLRCLIACVIVCVWRGSVPCMCDWAGMWLS